MAISGHEHSTLGPALGESSAGAVWYVSTLLRPRCVQHSASLPVIDRGEALRPQDYSQEGEHLALNDPAYASSGAAAWLLLSKHIEHVCLFHNHDTSKTDMVVDISLRNVLHGPHRADYSQCHENAAFQTGQGKQGEHRLVLLWPWGPSSPATYWQLLLERLFPLLNKGTHAS